MPDPAVAQGLVTSLPRISLSGRYAFMSVRPDYYGTPYPDELVNTVASAFYDHASSWRAQVESVFSQVQRVISTNYTEDTTGDYHNSTVHYLSSQYQLTNPVAFMVPYVADGTGLPYRDVWMNDKSLSWVSEQWTPSKTILHETLHAFGLGHAGFYVGPIWIGPDDRYTVMSYQVGIAGRPNESLGIYDILALQLAYPDAINFSFDPKNTYMFSGASMFDYYAIWDAAGIDHIDASNQGQGVVIDLRQGTLSDINSVAGYQYNIGLAYGVVLEDATGSASDDYIIGNVTSNHLIGGAGDDRIYGDGAGFSSYRPVSSYLSLGHTTNRAEDWFYPQHNGIDPRDTQLDRLEGGGGDDVLVGGSAFNSLYGGADDDTLIARGAVTHMWGGTGDDHFKVGANTWIEDGEAHDWITYYGIPIFGGTKQWWMESNTAYWAPFSTLMTAFPVIGSEILAAAASWIDVPLMKFAAFQNDSEGNLIMSLGWGHGGLAAIRDYSLDLDTGRASAGVVVFQASGGTGASGFTDPGDDPLIRFVNLALKAGFGIGFGSYDPLVLDLDGDGFELRTERNSGVHFEFDTDGFGERTGWACD